MVRNLNLNQPLIKCKCGKYFSPTREEADKTRRHVAAKNGSDNPVRYYQCKHGGWHWTQQLTDIRRCTGCHHMFRPSDEHPRAVLCPDCWQRRVDADAAHAAAGARKAAQRRAEKEAREAAAAAARERILRENRPTPAVLAGMKRTLP